MERAGERTTLFALEFVLVLELRLALCAYAAREKTLRKEGGKEEEESGVKTKD